MSSLSNPTAGPGGVAKVLNPPHLPDNERPSIFLAGSIQMGTPGPWQKDLMARLKDFPITIVNPHYEGPDWELHKHDPQSTAHMKWELQCQERVDVIAMYLEPGTYSPDTLVELGLFVSTGKLIVCCPGEFFRQGKVEVICEQHNVPCTEDWDTFVKQVIKKVQGLTTAD